MRQAVVIWWVWTARPFLLHPIRTIRDWLRRDEPFTQDELDSLTPQERKLLQ